MFLPGRLLALSLQRSDCWKKYLDYVRSLEKYVNCCCRIKFIENCSQADIIPRFLKFRIPENGCFEPTVVHNFQRNLLKAELNKARKLKGIHRNVIEVKRTILKECIPDNLIPSVVLYSQHVIRTTRLSVERTHSRKLKNLSTDQQRPLFDVQDTVKICDEDINPPRYVVDTLALGPKNAILDDFDSKETLSQIERLLYNCKKSKTNDKVMDEINIETFKYIKSCSKQKSPRNLRMTKRYLKEHNLLAVPFDKGVGICLMKRETYEQKIGDILKLD